MLGGAVQHRRWEEVEEIVPLLKTGVSESYQDVRELLQNFRTRLAEGSLRKAVDDTIDRFRRQTGTEVELLVDDRNGAPLHPEQQLQILFILQEALSNVRKHAQATHVTVRIDNHRDFVMLIFDNGRGMIHRKWLPARRRTWGCRSCGSGLRAWAENWTCAAPRATVPRCHSCWRMKTGWCPDRHIMVCAMGCLAGGWPRRWLIWIMAYSSGCVMLQSSTWPRRCPLLSA